MKKEIPFLKGHMGGNDIVLVPRESFPRNQELEMGLKVLDPPYVRGDQLGLLYEGGESFDLGAKIVDINSRDYLNMCGGLTQVLGRAHWELDLSKVFDLDFPSPSEGLELKTDMGIFPLHIDPNGGTTTVMDPFIQHVYDGKVEARTVNGVLSFRVGNFFVTFVEELKKRFPQASFSPLDHETKKTLIELQKGFRKEFSTGKPNSDFAILGEPESRQNDGRLIFPHNLSKGLLEPACGTGTIAVSLTLVERGLISENGEYELNFEAGGSGCSIGGPDLTKVFLDVKGDKVKSVQFSHSMVEVLAMGKLNL